MTTTQTPEPKKQISIAVVGDEWCGKSSLCGYLMFKLGGIDKRVIEKYEKEFSEAGFGKTALGIHYKTTRKYSQLVNTNCLERRGESTILSKFNLRAFLRSGSCQLIDTPSFSRLPYQTVRAIALSDAVLMVVSALSVAQAVRNGKTVEEAIPKEILLIAYALGKHQIVVAVTTLEGTTYRDGAHETMNGKAVYEDIKAAIHGYLQKLGFGTSAGGALPPVIPIDILGDVNVIETNPEQLSWYTGPTILDALEAIQEPARLVNAPFRMVVNEVHKIGGIGTCVVGKVVSGTLKTVDFVTTNPGSITAAVNSIESFHAQKQEVQAGDYASMNLKSVSVLDVVSGTVVGLSTDPTLKAVDSFTAQVVFFVKRVKPGYVAYLLCHTARVPCKITALIGKVDKKTGKVEVDNPESLSMNATGLVRLLPLKQICLEPFSTNPALGRIILYNHKKVVGVGVVKHVLHKN